MSNEWQMASSSGRRSAVGGQPSASGVERRLQALVWLMLFSFAAVAGSLIYWSSLRGPALLAREDNPRLVEAELRLLRGRILDREGRVLAQTVGPVNSLFRSYPLPGAAPAVGYYSLRHGTAGVEATFDAVLRGQDRSFWTEWWRQTLGRQRLGQHVRLTLDARWQQQAHELMAGHKGAAVLLSLPDGDIRVMVSQPSYDPNQLDEQFEALTADTDAPLLNRVTQGQYQPGRVLAPFVMAAGVEAGLVDLEAPATEAERTVRIDSIAIDCASAPPQPANVGQALRHGCPAPLLAVGEALGREKLVALWQRSGLTSAPGLAIPTTAGGAESPKSDAERAALGQGELTVSPLQVALAWASLANNGRLPAPQLVAAFSSPSGEWRPIDQPEPELSEAPSVAPEAARSVLAALAREAEWIEYSVPVLSGPGGTTNHWYLALAPASAPQYALVVVIEEATGDTAKEIGRALLRMVIGDA